MKSVNHLAPVSDDPKRARPINQRPDIGPDAGMLPSSLLDQFSPPSSCSILTACCSFSTKTLLPTGLGSWIPPS
jgi:hypothetical protein